MVGHLLCNSKNIDINLECHYYCELCDGPSNHRSNCTKCQTNPGIHPTETDYCKCNITHNYFEKEISASPIVKECTPCHPFCIECFGSQNTECYKCDPMLQGITLIDTMCICNINNGFYLEGTVCKPCHKYCLQCTGPSYDQCNTCVSSSAIAYIHLQKCRCRTFGPFYENNTDPTNPICKRNYIYIYI